MFCVATLQRCLFFFEGGFDGSKEKGQGQKEDQEGRQEKDQEKGRQKSQKEKEVASKT